MRKAKMVTNDNYKINLNVGCILGKDWTYECIGEFVDEETGKEMVVLRQGKGYKGVATEKANVKFVS